MFNPKEERTKLTTGHLRENYPADSTNVLLQGEEIDNEEKGIYKFVTVDPEAKTDYWMSVSESLDCEVKVEEQENDGLHVEVIFSE